MALIKCSECGKEISDKASACIHCGCPLDKVETVCENLEFPTLPDNLNIGKSVFGKTNYIYVNAKYYSEQKFKDFENGDYQIALHSHGLNITSNLKPKIKIHKSQIIDIFDYKETVTTDGNVIGKALVGGLLFGAVGAIVGGISGVEQRTIDGNILCIKFWDVESKSIVILSFLIKEPTERFVRKCKDVLFNPCSSETSGITDEEEKQQIAKQNNGCFIALGIAVTLFILFIIWLES